MGVKGPRNGELALLRELEQLCRERPPLAIAGPIADCLARLDQLRLRLRPAAEKR